LSGQTRETKMKLQIQNRQDFPVGAIRRVKLLETQVRRREKESGVAEILVTQDFLLTTGGRDVPVRRVADLNREGDVLLLGEEAANFGHSLDAGSIEELDGAFYSFGQYAIHCRTAKDGSAMVLLGDSHGYSGGGS